MSTALASSWEDELTADELTADVAFVAVAAGMAAPLGPRVALDCVGRSPAAISSILTQNTNSQPNAWPILADGSELTARFLSG